MKRRTKNLVDRVRRKYEISGPFTGRDFYRICRGEGIEVICKTEITAFLLVLPNSHRMINLPFRLRGLRRRHAMYHELGHHFLGHVVVPPWKGRALKDDLEESEADLFAKIALREDETMTSRYKRRAQP